MAKTVLNRTTFRTSRRMDFFSVKELVTQTGHGVEEWPQVIAKELTDNSLDACEQAGIAPEITITADATGITVADNGPGLPESTLAGAMDFEVRVSNREQYVAPDRGAQGNALKTLIAMPPVVDPEGGLLIVTTGGVRHEIACKADQVSQTPVIRDTKEEVYFALSPKALNSQRVQVFPKGTTESPVWSSLASAITADSGLRRPVSIE